MVRVNIILEKSYSFALRTVKLLSHLKDQKVERTLIIQLLRSGTSIGANVEEAIGGQTKKDFITKMNIAYKEARETYYWLRLLKDAGRLEKNLAESFLKDAEELKKTLASIVKSSKGGLLLFFILHF